MFQEKLDKVELSVLCKEEIKELINEKEIAENNNRELSEQCTRLQKIINDNKFGNDEDYYKKTIHSLTNRINMLMKSANHE